MLAFRGLQAESVVQGQAHHTVADELATLVADPFEDWAEGYKVMYLTHIFHIPHPLMISQSRLRQNKSTVMDNWLRTYQQAQGDVAKLKHQYLAKIRRADEAEDEYVLRHLRLVTHSPLTTDPDFSAKFAPSNNVPDKYTSSPRLRPADSRTPPQRSATVSERIAARFKELQKKGADALAVATTTDDSTPPEGEKPLPKVDKGKGKERVDDYIPEVASPPPMSPLTPPKLDLDRSSPMPPMPPPPILLAGLSLPPVAVSQLLTRAAAELPLRPVRFPLLGEYQDAFTGEEFVTWLKDNVDGFGGSLDRAEEAARDLTERENVLRRLGELGNQFELSDEAFYQFRPKVFSTHLEGVLTSLSDTSFRPLTLMERLKRAMLSRRSSSALVPWSVSLARPSLLTRVPSLLTFGLAKKQKKLTVPIVLPFASSTGSDLAWRRELRRP